MIQNVSVIIYEGPSSEITSKWHINEMTSGNTGRRTWGSFMTIQHHLQPGKSWIVYWCVWCQKSFPLSHVLSGTTYITVRTVTGLNCAIPHIMLETVQQEINNNELSWVVFDKSFFCSCQKRFMNGVMFSLKLLRIVVMSLLNPLSIFILDFSISHHVI